MERKQEVSKAVIQRLPRYYRNICELKAEGEQRISSKALAERMGLTASQIRQDFNCFGGFGQQGYGYNIDKLQEELGAIMGLRTGRTAILLGAGNLGRALLNNFNFSASGFELLCAFDANPQLIGQRFGGHEVRSADTLAEFIERNKPDVAVLTIPRGDAPAYRTRSGGARYPRSVEFHRRGPSSGGTGRSGRKRASVGQPDDAVPSGRRSG